MGEVVSVSCQWNESDRMIYTYIKINVVEDIKGNLRSRTIVLKQLGGQVGDTEMVIFDSPVFVSGQRVLLFLNTASDGTLRVAHLFQGKFDITFDGQVRRQIEEPSILIQGNGADYTYSASLNSFKDRISTMLVERQKRIASYEKSRINQPIVEVPVEYQDDPTVSGPTFGLQFVVLGRRWFEPDFGQIVYYYVNSENAPIAGGGIAQVDQALAAWSNVTTASIILGNGGPTSTQGFRFDGVSTVSFGDPFDQMPDPIQCVGIVAVGGYVRTGDSGQITEADVVLNRNFECILGNSANLAEVICHELGHTIGLDHSLDPTAIMFAWSHINGRGATLAQDDINGLVSIYPGPKLEPPPTPVVDGATFMTQIVPETMIAGRKYRATIIFRNSGTSTWKSGRGYYLGAQNPQSNTAWNTNMVFMEGKVKPNRQIEFSFRFRAPSQPGLYNFQWGMEHNGQPFGQFSQNLVINVVSQ